MHTIAPKTPATLPFAAWQALTPAAAAHEVHARLAALPDALRRAALAWPRPEAELAADLGRAANRAGPRPLRGVPYLLKDLFDLAGVPTRAGSTFLDQVRPLPVADSQIAQRLGQLGASCAGKTHLVEFASGLTGENPHYGDCPHPLFPDRLSGGSSSGSAALVAAGVVPLAVGTDTGGSVRVPAAFCGLYGFRLTPRDALIADAFPLAPTMDTAGWLTANAGDLRTVWQAMLGPGSAKAEMRGCYLPMRAVLPAGDPATAAACDAAAARICAPADATTQGQLLESWREAVDAYLTIGMSEAHRVHHNWLAPFREHYDPVIWQRFTDAGSLAAEKIARAHATLTVIGLTWREFFFNYDYLILPAVPCPAPRKADCTPELRRAILTLTAPASLGGLPVLSIPVPLAEGLTVGLQIVLPAANSPVVPWLLNS
jgi:amidase/aspartyl-tRNA(Asn)/glutamyl-tRNA(Gln) amidotransferase subunit A